MRLRDKLIKNSCGTLLAISSLPSKDGIGTFGIDAYKFIDFLKATRQKYWQMLPLVPLGEGNSPYKSISCFAGEMLYIDLPFLVRDGLLPPSLLKDMPQGPIDYNDVRQYKIPLLKIVAQNFDTQSLVYRRFLEQNEFWIEDYALFAAALDVFKTDRLSGLSGGIKYRIPTDMRYFDEQYFEEIEFHKIMQFLFFKQFFELKAYAQKSGIKFIGDIPFYVSADSADVWKNPDYFAVGRDFTPTLVAGVPPDIFSENGQLWGNPIYNWENHRKNDYQWWRRRLGAMADMFDVIRIDHFRAFADYYVIPNAKGDARCGNWQKGEGIRFWNTIEKYSGRFNIIAEDLGGEDSPEVAELIRKTGFPNMKVLQFAFTGNPHNCFLPQNFNGNCVCYTGTHDNDTSLGWYNNADRKTRMVFNTYLPPDGKANEVYRLIGAAATSNAALMVIPMQDWLCLDSSARMNTPGTANGNWKWRLDSCDFDESIIKDIQKIASRKK